MTRLESHKELIVWQRSIQLVKAVFSLTTLFPPTETYGIISQMRRAVIAIPSNIAEGYGRRSRKEYLQYCSIAYGSALELETQLIVSKDIFTIQDHAFQDTERLLEEVLRMLNVMITKLKV